MAPAGAAAKATAKAKARAAVAATARAAAAAAAEATGEASEATGEVEVAAEATGEASSAAPATTVAPGMRGDECAVCKLSWDPANGSFEHMQCAHPIHTYCLEGLMSALGITDRTRVRCPSCRRTADDLTDLEMRGRAVPTVEVGESPVAVAESPVLPMADFEETLNQLLEPPTEAASTTAPSVEDADVDDDDNLDQSSLTQEAMASQPDDQEDEAGGNSGSAGSSGDGTRAPPAEGALPPVASAAATRPSEASQVEPPPAPHSSSIQEARLRRAVRVEVEAAPQYQVSLRESRARAAALGGEVQDYTGQPSFIGMTAYCGNCGCDEPVADVRIRNKGARIGRCKRCCVRVTQLQREFGKWPHPAFKAMSESDQISFFQDLKTISSAKALKLKADEAFARYNEEEEFYEEDGRFLPLSVWGNQGFDTSLIRLNSLPKNIKMHSVLGEVFRVPILSMGTRGACGWKRSSGQTSTGPCKKLKASKTSSGAAEMVEEEEKEERAEVAEAGDDDDDSSSNSSSSNSSSSNGGGKKKSKTDKKERKRTTKTE